MTGQRKSLTQRLLEGGVTTGLLLFALVPVYWMVSSSLKSDPELSQIEATWFPHEATFDQYRAALDQTPLLGSLLLTGILAVATAVIVVIFGSLAAYAVTQWSFPGKDSFLGVTLFTQLLPQSGRPAVPGEVRDVQSQLHASSSSRLSRECPDAHGGADSAEVDAPILSPTSIWPMTAIPDVATRGVR